MLHRVVSWWSTRNQDGTSATSVEHFEVTISLFAIPVILTYLSKRVREPYCIYMVMMRRFLCLSAIRYLPNCRMICLTELIFSGQPTKMFKFYHSSCYIDKKQLSYPNFLLSYRSHTKFEVEHYNELLRVYIANKRPLVARKFFSQMDPVKPNVTTYELVLRALGEVCTIFLWLHL